MTMNSLLKASFGVYYDNDEDVLVFYNPIYSIAVEQVKYNGIYC